MSKGLRRNILYIFTKGPKREKNEELRKNDMSDRKEESPKALQLQRFEKFEHIPAKEIKRPVFIELIMSTENI